MGTRWPARVAGEHITAAGGAHHWYGAYDFSHGQALLRHEGKCNSEHTVQFVQRLHAWQAGTAPATPRPLVLIRDGAPWHRSASVRRQAEQLGIELVPLSAYSSDLNPIEGLWKWMRAEG